jgi:hypothetical protein
MAIQHAEALEAWRTARLACGRGALQRAEKKKKTAESTAIDLAAEQAHVARPELDPACGWHDMVDLQF